MMLKRNKMSGFGRGKILLLATALLALYSCKSPREKDMTFTPEKYMELGMPDFAKIWTEDDYMKATTTLYDIQARYPNSLPMANSEKSGVYFDRIINLDNLYFMDDDTYSLSEKAFHIQLYLGAQSELVNIYHNLYTKKQYYHRELVLLNDFSLKILEEMLTLADRIMQSDDPEDIKLQPGLKTVQEQYLMKFNQLLMMQKDTAAYPVGDLEELSQIISDSLLKNISWMGPVTKAELKQQFSVLISSASSETVKSNLQKAQDALQ